MKYKECRYKLHDGNKLVAIESMIRDKSRKDGYAEICKICAYKRKKEYLHRVYSGDVKLQSVKNFRRNESLRNIRRKVKRGIEHTLYKSVKIRSAQKGLEFDLLLDDIIIPDKCPILDITLSRDVYLVKDGVKRNSPFPDNYPTVDRINSDKGYTKDNYQIISWKANRLKSNASIDDIRKLYEWTLTIK